MKHLGWLLLAPLLACGYHLGGAGTTVPAGARTIGIQLFHSHVRETGLEVHLRRAIEDEFRRRGVLRVVAPGEADLVLSGDIRLTRGDDAQHASAAELVLDGAAEM